MENKNKKSIEAYKSGIDLLEELRLSAIQPEFNQELECERQRKFHEVSLELRRKRDEMWKNIVNTQQRIK